MRKRLHFAEFVIISFILHCLLVALMTLQKQKAKPAEVVIDIVENTPPPPPPPVLNKKPVEEVKQQVVEQEEKKSDEPAPDTRFLSAQNQNVKKQTVARNKGEFKNSKKKDTQKSSEKSKTWDLSPKLNVSSGLKKVEKKPENQESDSPASASDISQSSDYIKDVDEGLETILNSKEFKYYTYYNRIRRQLSQHWEPKVKGKLSQMFRQGRYLASDSDRVTKLIVVLDQGGNLVKVQVLKHSGVTDLDEAATEAFQSAAPFPNPPAGIVDSDGTVKIRWDFVLEG
jgi:TonB family protein